MRFPYLCFLSPSVLNKCDKRDSELERDNMSKCCKFWKYVFPNCAAWCWPDDKGPTTPCKHSAGKPRRSYVQLLFVICQVLSKVLLNKWDMWEDTRRIRPSTHEGFLVSHVSILSLSASQDQTRGPQTAPPLPPAPFPAGLCPVAPTDTHAHTSRKTTLHLCVKHFGYRRSDGTFFPNQLHKLN